MSEMVAFVAARLDEVEAIAKAAIDSGDGTWGAVEWMGDACRVEGDDMSIYYGITEQQAAHIALHDPARELRDVAAKRLILEEHSDTHDCGDPRSWESPYLGCHEVRALAAIDNGHPDYQPQWAV